MKSFTHKKYWRYIIVVLAILIGLILVRVSLKRSITVILDEIPFTVRTSALKVSGALRAAGATLIEEDLVDPPLNDWLGKRTTIRVTTAQQVTVITQQEEYEIVTPERIPSNILSDLGIDLFPQDQVLLNDEVVDPLAPLEIQDSIVLQYQPAVSIDIEIDSVTQTIYTHQPTLGAALEAASIPIGPQDWVSMDLMSPVDHPISVTIRRAQPLTVNIGGTSFMGLTAATSVGRALMDVGLPLQNLDFSIPGEGAPLPEDREIEIVRVSEDVIIATDEIAYESEYVEDPETVLDQYSVVQTGKVGIYATRERVQYANGEETRRIAEGTWKASDAQTEVLGYGTRVEIRTEVVDGITIEYWRKKYVYATSYEPCDKQGNCHDGTAGGYPLQIGIVAVTPQWYSVPNGLAMADLPVYVPGYGRAIIGDVGGGISGTPWIDLAYRPEDDFTWDAHWLTMYFLTPVPNWYPAIITP